MTTLANAHFEDSKDDVDFSAAPAYNSNVESVPESEPVRNVDVGRSNERDGDIKT
jgi:hypothetical protein